MARIVNAPPRIMEGASADEPGVAGYVPTPPAGPVADGLRRDGTYGPTNSSGGGGGGGGDGIPADGSVTNAKVAANAAIALSKLAVDPLARSAHTGTQAQNTVVNLVADLAAKATGAALTAHTADTSNPHSVTKAQVGLTNADDTSDANKPVSTAQAAALALKADAAHAHDAAAITSGSLDPERLPAPTTTTIGGVKRNAGSAGQFVNGIDASGGLVFGDPPGGGGGGTPDAHAASHAEEGSDPVSPALIGAATDAALTAHATNTGNPHAVSKAQVGLTNADDTSDVAKPISTATQAALDAKASTAALGAHVADTANPHAVTKAQVGLTNADDTSDANKPVSTAQAAVIALKADATTVSTHIADTANPHSVTKAQVGLASADDTSDANKPISTATAAALALKADTSSLGTMASQAASAVAITGGSLAGISTDLSGVYKQTINAVGALDIDCSLGNYFTKTIAGNSTFTFSTVPASRAFAFTLELTHTSGTVTWPTSVKWPGDTAPSLTAGKTHLFTFVTDDGGTRWRGASQINYTN